MIHDIGAATDPKQVAAGVQKLQPVLQRHFAEEEQEMDGLHAVIQKRTPELLGALHDLRQEHAQLLVQVEQLLAAARRAPAGDTRLQALGQQLRDQLGRHESHETQVFMDSIWTDTGGGSE